MCRLQERILATVITTCTNRKRKPVCVGLHAGELERGDLARVASEWGSRVSEAAPTYPAGSLYGGRSFRDSSVAAEKARADLLIVSAGLGLVRASARIPSYACTVLNGAHDSIAARVTGPFSKSSWWTELHKVSPFASKLTELIEGRGGLILAALSDGYIEMMLQEFIGLPEERRAVLRLFTRTPVERIPEQLRPFLMPYDDRLEGPNSPIRGTRSDFAARALRHFVEVVMPASPDASAKLHAQAVRDTLECWSYPRPIERERLSDDEITRLLHEHWESACGSSSRLLRHFRDQLNIACEQGRFALLARKVKAERA